MKWNKNVYTMGRSLKLSIQDINDYRKPPLGNKQNNPCGGD